MGVENSVEVEQEALSHETFAEAESSVQTDVEVGPPKRENEASRVTGLRIFRATQQEEILAIRDIALEFHNESRYAHIPFSEKKFVRAFSKGISSPEDTLAIYVQHQGKTVGLLSAGAGDYYLGEGGRMVTIYAVYVSASIRDSLLGGKVGLKLIRMAGDWAKAQRAEELHIHATSGIEPKRTDKLLRRLGFKTFGGNYSVRVG